MEHRVSVVPKLTWVALDAAVVRPEAESVAVMVAVAPVGAPHRAATTPEALTAATAVFDERKSSPAAASDLVDPSL
jgi:hypothetical protein